MTERRNHWPMALIFTIMLVTVIIWAGCKKQPSEPVEESTDELPKNDTELFVEPKISLKNIIETARTWGPASDFESWFGKPAPDFILTDITGKQHKLSDYRGKNVMIIFWTTWSGQCRMEIPHLIELRNTVEQDKLAMLAVSNESTALLKDFVTQQKINYAVFSNQEGMPEPYSLVRFILCSFFIDPEGKIKLATIGLLPLSDMKAIIQAK